MEDFSILIGGIAGDGINEAGLTAARLMNRLGYRIFMYYDYPSLIKGGHNFSMVRASSERIGVCRDEIDLLIALNQDTVDRHSGRLKEGSIFIFDADNVMGEGIAEKSCGISVTGILKEEGAPSVMKNSCILGAFCHAVGIEWTVLEEVLKKHIPKKLELNLKVARRGYDQASEFCRIAWLDNSPEPIITGNQAISLGLIRAGLEAYVAYPMTPSSAILDFMANSAEEFGLKVVHPESEIAVILMAEGFAYAGVRAAVGTSGGGFCLMTEALSLAGMAEIPLAIVVAQRTGPSTGLPTYTAQGDLHFVINAGQGEFPRLVIAPGDAEDAYLWSAAALNLAWKYQIPAFILSDKIVSESQYSLDLGLTGKAETARPAQLWNEQGDYHRYRHSDTGVSPLAYPPQRGQVIKADSYAHDATGITTEDPQITREMSDKRVLKAQSLARELEGYETVKLLGDERSRTCLLFWGSNKGVCKEAADSLGLRAVQVLVLWPFPENRLKDALRGVERLIAVECNATGQLATLCRQYGIDVDDRILKYDGRPFSLNDLEIELERREA
ncbi:MAG: 2-oxoacid:acceptor oxidoreductase subunit alpha [Methanothrix soehngenii]|jgi:2-oxoglutarate ferredoxin oxidoreductase subunit alpha|uniref:Pyruvate flavodoxin/ferredoxin oxidoreductase domain protein n=1 Tax=Methanothrix soehngenii (strain ATCC 5969 / DSM 3671 / JCM 10134 / NBRC 103675 / OCM 69 / GP-6) TaxID=990316 RepID=F4BZS2_METSG|nr:MULTISPECIES: 2-oxoacid:acceptor oxidoreductase subunit alpha [Methanothrix]AEB69067.1 pyruvate flavodoxin/ferredoxin oxidoreductase domain protein [Methanothrix soehngenii GP6]MDD3551936.1 2-oxoacid:acceptor oxidoreductase subunit alpha [Methanothrix soehngenii]UEC40479.1 MAG: 2-oxoglutarate oxidoreductase, alpha subunit [Methanothrix sp.]HNQ52429.1 2-oxoacid:acceptor oxidoreductase subunit alpha [Methanothrix soehngenii]HNT46255.1 2-oxoacid:acceptor oxidoreductase subunit alpha [Methanoth